MVLRSDKRASGLGLVLLSAVLLAGAALQSANAASLTFDNNPTPPQGWTSGAVAIATSLGAINDSTSIPNYSTANTIYADVAIINNGATAAGPFNVTFNLDGVPVPSATQTVAGLAAGARIQIHDASIMVPPLAEGPHAIQVIINPADPNAANMIRNIQVFLPQPVITSATTAGATAGSGFSYQIQASNTDGTTIYDTNNLPAFLTLDQTSGLIGGLVPVQQTTNFTFTVFAQNSGSISAGVLVTVTVAPARPIIFSSLNETAQLGLPFTYTALASGTQPLITISPPGISGLTAGGAIISGTPTQQGTIFFTITATNASGTDVKTLTVNVQGPPIINSDLSVSGTTGIPFTYQITGAGSPYAYGIGGDYNWPNPLNADGYTHITDIGLSLNVDTGMITGVPTLATVGPARTFTFPIFTTNLTGSATATLIIGIQNGAQPAIASPLTIYGFAPLQFDYKIQSTPAPKDATGPLVYSFLGTQNLPPGINPTAIPLCDPLTGAPVLPGVLTGELEGTPQAEGYFPGDITGANGVALQVSYLDKNGVKQTVTQPISFFIDTAHPHITSDKTVGAGGVREVGGVNGNGGFFTWTGTATTDPNTIWRKFNIAAFPGAIDTTDAGVSMTPGFPGGGTQNKPPPGGFAGNILEGGAPTPGIYWAKVAAIDNGVRSTEVDPWPYVALGFSEMDIPPTGSGATFEPGKLAPIVPMTSFTVTCGVLVPGALEMGIAGANDINTAFIVSDGVTLNPLPNGNGGIRPAGTYGLGAIGLGQANGALTGVPAVAGVWFITMRVTDTNPGQFGYKNLTGYGMCTLRVEHIKAGQPVMVSPNVAVGQLDNPFTYTLDAVGAIPPVPGSPLTVGYAFTVIGLPTGLTLTGGGIGQDSLISGIVPSMVPVDPANPGGAQMPNPEIDPTTGAVGPLSVTIIVSTPVGFGNTFIAPDTETSWNFNLTLVFWDMNPNKPAIASPLNATMSELVPFQFKVLATQSANSITAVTEYSNGNIGLPPGLSISSPPVTSQVLITGIPELGTSEFYPGETLRPKDNWVLFRADNIRADNGLPGTGFGTVQLVTNPAPPNISPTIDSAALANFLGLPWSTFSRVLGMETSQTVGENLFHAGYTPTGYLITNGYQILGPQLGGPPLLSAPPNQFDAPNTATLGEQLGLPVLPDKDTYWDKYLLAPYNATATIFSQATNLPGGQSLDTKSGIFTGFLTTPASQNTVIVVGNQTGADTRSLQVNVLHVKITSPYTATAIVGVPYTYQVAATGQPNFFDANGLPPGLSINHGSGLITGTPLIPSDPNNPANPVISFPVVLSASNAYDTGTQQQCLKVSQLQNTPVITSSTTPTGFDGVPFNYLITATVPPPSNFTPPVDTSITGFTAAPLPKGLVLNDTKFLADGVTPNPNFGLISGTPIGFGNYDIILTASNAFGMGGKIIHLDIKPVLPSISPTQPPPGIVGLAYSFDISYTGSQAVSFTYADPAVDPADALPPGLVGSGPSISGIPTKMGAYPVTITASNPAGTIQFTILINVYQRPLITSPLTASVIVGQQFSYTITTSGSPQQLVITANPLPAGLSFDGINTISGIPTQAGATNVTMNATNITGPQFTKQSQVTLVITVVPYEITSTPPIIIGTVGIPIVPYTVTATVGGGPYTFTAFGLPRALSIDSGTGIISGVPLIAGSFSVDLTATNGTGSATSQITVAISSGTGIPAITSPLTASGTLNSGVPLIYTITASNTPTSFNAVPVDPTVTLAALGLNFDPVAGTLTGSPKIAGTFEIQISAGNALGTGSAILVLGISAVPNAPAIISPLEATGLQGAPFTYKILGSNNPSGYNANIDGLSLATIGLSVDPLSGFITGNPTPAPGVYFITISASNAVGTGSATLALTVLPPTPPTILPPLSVTGTVGLGFFYAINANGFPSSFGAQTLPFFGVNSLPFGLTVDTIVGSINGVPLLAGVYAVPITATNLYGTDTKVLTITISAAPGSPTITSPATIFSSISAPFSYQITATGNPSSFNAANLPSGLFINTNTGLVSGAATQVSPPGGFQFIVLATNAAGTGSELVTLTVASPFPTLTNAAALTGNVGIPINYPLLFTGNLPITITIDKLPPGLTLTGSVISGTPIAQGVINAIITATNNAGTTSTPFTFTIGPPIPPVLLGSVAVTGMISLPFTYNLTQGLVPGAVFSQPVTFTLDPTTLPPGLTFNGTAIVGTPTKNLQTVYPATFQITISASSFGNSASQQLTITILDIVPGVDTDGDCFPDDLEIALGSNPLDPTSTPFGLPACGGQPFNLPNPKIGIKLDFATFGKDTITLSGSLPVQPGFSAPGQRVIAYVGGIFRIVTLGANGVSTTGDKLTMISIKAPRASIHAQNAKYSVKMKGDFTATLARSSNLTSSPSVTKVERNVFVSIIVGNNVYSKTQEVQYTAKAGKSGMAR